MVSLNLPHHPFLLKYLVLLQLSQKLMLNGAPKSILARGGKGVAYTLYCWKILCRARLSSPAQMLESGYWPETGNWLETRIWLGFDAAVLLETRP